MLSPDFPKIAELPLLADPTKWVWTKKKLGFGLNERKFWIGTDPHGKCWIVKMHDKYDAVRERVYASLSQHLGICTQSSSYLLLPHNADPVADPIRGKFHTVEQLAVWPLDEHAVEPCCNTCPLARLTESRAPQEYFDSWLGSGVRNPRDWFDATMLGYLCRKYEPTGSFLTKTHWWVQIDNEKMFTGPYGERGVDSVLGYIRCDPMMRIVGAKDMLNNLCERMASTTDDEFEEFLILPPGYRAKTHANHFKKSLRRARRAAKHILRFGLG